LKTSVSDLLQLNKQAFHDINAHTTLQIMPSFAGDPNESDVKKWFKTIERVTTLWDDEDRLRHFPLKLTGIALKFHDKLDIHPLTYHNWKDTMIKRFYVPRSTAYYKLQFENLVIKPNERIIDFTERLDDIFTKAFNQTNLPTTLTTMQIGLNAVTTHSKIIL